MTDVTAPPPPVADRLDSWKEIAAHLRRDVRTVQRWEKSEGLPVHRHLHQKLGSIYAYRGELDRWWQERGQRLALAPEAARVMLAVLPFENWSGDSEQDYFSDGITAEMIVRLGRLNPERLGVIAPISAMAYKRTQKSVAEIRRELGVDYLVSGSVRRSNGQVRITAHLIQASDQTQIWAESHDRNLSDILLLQSEVAEAIAHQVHVTLAPRVPGRRRVIDPEAYEANLKGRFFLDKRTPESLARSIDYFEESQRLDPNNALAYTGQADAYDLMAYYGIRLPNEVYPKAKVAAEKALALDPTLPDAHAALAEVSYLYDWDWQTAEREFERAIELGPNSVAARQWFGVFLSLLGRHEESIEHLRQASRLDPLSLVIGAEIGLTLYGARRFDEAIAQYERVIELDRSFGQVRAWLALVYLQQSRWDVAIEELNKARDLAPGDLTPIFLLGFAFGRSGRRAEARKVLQELKSIAKQRYVSSVYPAGVELGLGNDDVFFDLAEKALAERAGFATRLRVEPLFDPVRGDRRFDRLLRTVGLANEPAPRAPTRHKGK